MDSKQICIIVPAWNEEATVEDVVKGILPLGRVLVVDDASADRTAERAESAGAEVVRHEENRGYVGALSSGFDFASKAGSKFILTYDADGQHDIENLKEVISLLENGADLVAGILPFRPRLSEKFFALTFYWFYGIRDPLCGLKGYRVSLYHDSGFFDRCNSYGADLLRFACAHRDQYRIETISVCIHDRSDNPRNGSRVKANLSILSGMLRLYFIKAS